MIKSYSKVIENIRSELKAYIMKHDIKALILGVSGGIDSAAVAALARPICDELKIKLIGRSLPIHTNMGDEISRAHLIGSNFCTDFETINLEECSDCIQRNIFTEKDSEDEYDSSDLSYKIRRGNMKARLRMIYLYDLAYKNKGIVLSTDNYTEYLLGFWTLHGDVGDYGMIQNLWKTEVYRLAKHLAAPLKKAKCDALTLCVDATPTDGLGITSSDCEQLGAKDYNEVDDLLSSYIIGRERFSAEGSVDVFYDDKFEHPVIKRYEETHWKRSNPCSILRKDLKK
ncbi:MAG: NAD(+) synthase [Parcubacteria group bacterium]|nr:NAD(+) synthase [Parcubacteria group bacterium]